VSDNPLDSHKICVRGGFRVGQNILLIYKTIEKRKDTPLNEYIDLDQLLVEQGIDLDAV